MQVVMKSVAGLFGIFALVLASGAAIADESPGREIAVPVAAVGASSECPKSVSQRYPWIACRTTAMGTQVIAGRSGPDTWENSRATPGTHPFVNGGGYFGPVENR